MMHLLASCLCAPGRGALKARWGSHYGSAARHCSAMTVS